MSAGPRQLEGAKRGGAASVARRRAEKEAGMAFAREWRETHRDTVWGIPPQPKAPRCPTCDRPL